MTTERFSKGDFENVLREFTGNHALQMVERGCVAGEYRYHVIAKHARSRADVFTDIIIEVASSVGENGFADDTGENSIRLWLSGSDGLPLGNKISRWVTRVSGWEKRLTIQLTKMFEMAGHIEYCGKCRSMRKVFITKNGKPENKGRLFSKCNCQNSFKWLDEYDQAPAVDYANGEKEVAKKVGATGDNPYNMKDVLAAAKQKAQEVKQAPAKTFTPSKYQVAIFNRVSKAIANKEPLHLVVKARAGTGKTTTGEKMVGIIPMSYQGLFIAFNKHIADEMKRRLVDRSNIKVCTLHSLGYAALTQAMGRLEVDDYRTEKLCEQVLDKWVYKPLFSTIARLVSLVKANLLDGTDADLDYLAEHHGVELNGDKEVVFKAVQAVMLLCKKTTSVIDYDDMIWLPVVMKLPMRQYDVIFIDEAQDINKCQNALAMKAVKPNGIIVAVGDEFQSLYGFRGADVDAIPSLIDNLQAEVLPLSLSYRCPKAVVKLVNDKFPHIDFECPDTAGDGIIRQITEDQAAAEYTPGDMVLCRTNAPLVAPAFALIRQGVKAIIRGRDIGKGLTALIKKMKAADLMELISKLTNYKNTEVAKLLAAEKGSQAQSLQDKVDTIVALADGVSTIAEVENRIDNIFKDENEGVVFSSVHRAKGLEAQRVYILQPGLMPHPMAKQPWERQQESNIIYVAYTRSLCELVFVS